MIAAANAVFLDLAAVERGTTVAAACVKQAGAAVLSRRQSQRQVLVSLTAAGLTAHETIVAGASAIDACWNN